MSDSGVLEAAAMSHAALSDPQFRLPRLPRFPGALVVVPADGGLIVEGGPTRQLLGGSRAGDVLGRLLPLLDGSRSLERIAAESDQSVESVHAAVSLLYASGLLEDGNVAPDIGGTDAATLAYYSRSIDSTRVNASGAQAVSRLRAARVAIAADAESLRFAGAVADHLAEGGIGRVQLLDGMDDLDDATLALLIGSSERLTAIAEDAAARRIGVHPVRVGGSQLLYGPYIDPAYTVGYQDISTQVDAGIVLDPPRQDTAFAAALIAGEILSLLSRVGTTPSQQSLVRVDLDTLQQERLVAVSSTPDGIPLAYAFEASTAFPPRALAAPKDHQVHYKQSNVALQRDSKRWPSAPTLAMPARAALLRTAEMPDPDAEPIARALTAEAVADIIIRSAGNRDSGTPQEGKVRRWAASGGNLGSVQAYLIARRVSGLAPGAYGYQRGDDTLAVLPWADPEATFDGTEAEAPAVLVLTGALGRVASKYAAFAWRIVHLDTGVAITQARLLAAAHGIRAEVAPVWDDGAVADLLGIDQDAEPITAILTLHVDRHPERSEA